LTEFKFGIAATERFQDAGEEKMPLFDNELESNGQSGANTTKVLACAVFSVAIAARIVPFLVSPSIYHPDEIFQVTEQAHRIVYGNGLVPWEFEYGTRSWILPGIVIAIMKVTRVFAEGPEYYLPAIWLFFAAISTCSAVCAFLWGQRFFGPAGGLLAAIMPAFAADAIYFSGHTLSEVVTAHILIIGIYLAYPGYKVTSPARLFSVGLFLGITAVLRTQLLPAAAIILVWLAVNSSSRQLALLVSGFAFVCLLGGMIDALTWGVPFLSIWRNFSFNLLYGVSSSFGTQPWYQYAGYVFTYWGGGVAVLLTLAFIGSYRLPLLLLVSIVIFLSHTFVPHKDYRFIYPALILLVVLAGVGVAQVTQWMSLAAKTHFDRHSRIYPLCVAAAACFCVVFVVGQSASRAISPREDRRYPFWGKATDIIKASAVVAKLPSVCGIGSLEITWWQTGGYTLFHLSAPYYWFESIEDLSNYVDNFNTLLYSGPLPQGFGFTTLKCTGAVCIAQRRGHCEPREMKHTPVPAPLTAMEALVRK
jgi:GPI mannosyltransferase 3